MQYEIPNGSPPAGDYRGAVMPNNNNNHVVGGANLSREERACLQRFLNCLMDLRDQRSTMTLNQAIALFHVALHEGMGVQELASQVNVAQSVMSRNLLDLGPHTRSKEPGAGLVQHRMSATNMRQHEVLLTDKGARIMRKIAKLCGR